MTGDQIDILVFVVLVVVFPVVVATVAYRKARARERARFAVPQEPGETGTTSEADLGALVRRHETDNARRGRTAVLALAIGVVGLGLVGTLFVLAGPPRVVNVAIAGVVLGVPALCLWRGVVDGIRCYTRRAESFSVYEGGLVYAYAGHTRVIGWADFASVVNDGRDNVATRGLGKDTRFSRFLGRDVHCRVQLRDGTRFRITGFTRDAAQLADGLSRAVYERTQS
ncbi:MAG: hypothetical protein GEV07_26975 [Streptosporangiales bacterium]|nr:hypothetical protein [Streptosporangiales bacterium]